MLEPAQTLPGSAGPRQRAGLALILALAACRGECPPPTVSGGTEAERAVAASEVRSFYDLLVDPICVPSVRLRPMSNRTGRYNSVTQRIRIAEAQPGERLRSTVRHELCHAVQRQHGIAVRDHPLWQLDPSFDLDALTRLPERRRAEEAFAFTCESGALTLHLMGDTCARDPEGTGAFAVLRDLFEPPDAIAALDVTFTAVGAIPLAPYAAFTVTPTVEHTLRIEVRDDGERDVLYVDPYTGDRTSDAPALDPRLVEGADAVAPATMAWGVSTGAEDLVMLRAIAANGADATRLAYRDAGGWTRLGCLRPDEAVFAVDGRVWSAFRDGSALVWGTWQPR